MSSPDRQVYNGRYELQRKIARGGMADVFLAHDVMLDRPVALKVLFPEFATDPAFVQRFRGEARAAANLSHPNIVSVYDWGEQAGTYYIVMEYVEGQSLAQTVRERGPLDPDEAADITADIAAGLAFAHSRDVIHRDVKPGNVLISGTGHVKVTDFGIARAVSSQENLTQTGTVMGTATYFSPEQARGESVDPRSDVYSLGVVLYEILAGRPPFSGDSPVSVAYKHVQEAPEPIDQLRPDVPADLAAIVHTALAKTPDGRYGSADELRDDLRRFREGRPVLAGSYADATTAMAGAPTAALGATTAVGATRAQPAYDDGTWATPAATGQQFVEEPTEKRRPVFIIALVVLLLLLAAGLVAFAQMFGFGSDAEQVQVPGVVDLRDTAATELLAAEGFEVEREFEESEAEAGVVIAQDPEEGQLADEGSTVTITVSEGPEPVAVPDVVGRQEADAVALLEGAGLVPVPAPVPDDDAPEGEVIRQDPQADEEVPPGTDVQIDVSSGPQEMQVPDVEGQTASEASNILGQAGFSVQTTQEESDDVESGRVIRTQPGAGTTLSPGSTITLVVSSGSGTDEATVPGVVDRSASDAASTLRNAGFRVQEVPRTVDDASQDGRVVGQDPAGGATRETGTVVTIVVGEFFGQPPQQTTTTTAPAGGGSGGGGSGSGGGGPGGGGGSGQGDPGEGEGDG